MRISRRTASQTGFWRSTQQWVQSRHGWRQFILAALVGVFAGVGLGAAYLHGAWRWVQAPAQALLAEAQQQASEDLTTNDLPTLYLDIPFADYQVLATQRDNALEVGVLTTTDADWHKATLRYQDDSISIRLRLKGDWLDHLGDKKWSFHVETRNDAVLMGMRVFSLQSPATRAFLNEWLFLSELRRANVLAPRYSFVNLTVNGDTWGIYALEEGFSKELLEAQGRRESVIVRYDESLMWERNSWASAEQRAGAWDPAANYDLFAYAQADEFNTKSVQSDPVLREQSMAALGLLRGFQSKTLSPSEAFDVDLMGRYLAQTTLWFAGHGLVWINERYYYNPVTTKLEPIGYDALALKSVGFKDGLAQYDDLNIMEAYAREMQRIARPEFLQELQALYGQEFERYRTALLQEFAPADLEPPWAALSERQAMLTPVFLGGAQPVYAYQVNAEPVAGVDVQVGNILAYPVAIAQIQGNGVSADIPLSWVADSDRDFVYTTADGVILRRANEVSPRYVTLHIPAEVAAVLVAPNTPPYSSTLQITTQVVGVEPPQTLAIRADYPPILTKSVLPAQPSVEQALEQHPFLMQVGEGVLALKPGEFDVTGDLILPAGYVLRGTGDTTLRFDEGAVLLTTSPLQLQAAGEDAIRLLPKGAGWAGVAVLQAGEDNLSILDHVVISGTTSIAREGWTTTGGVTFYESPVSITQCSFLYAQSEDAVNVMHSHLEMTASHFANSSSDALDGDYIQGYVADCTFADVRGDCIDVSGSQITVTNVSVLRIADKGISAGEGSSVMVTGLRARDVGIAIASKDMSHVTAQDVYIYRAAFAGLAAYTKKPEYGTASITATAVSVGDESIPAVAQLGSSISLNGSPVSPSELDVDALYALLEARASMEPLSYALGPSISLEGDYLATPTLQAGGSLRLVLEWQTSARLSQDYTVFVHVLNAEGQSVAQHDAMPANNTMPTSLWGIDLPVYDTVTISLPPDLPAGEYHLEVGMYLWQTGDRLPITAADGSDVAGAALTLPCTLTVAP